jgi:hypothetical protein
MSGPSPDRTSATVHVRLLSTPAGDIELRIPELRTDSFFPSLPDEVHYLYLTAGSGVKAALVDKFGPEVDE